MRTRLPGCVSGAFAAGAPVRGWNPLLSLFCGEIPLFYLCFICVDLWLKKLKNRTFLFPGNKTFSATHVVSHQFFDIMNGGHAS
jgi:hypothetical protein